MDQNLINWLVAATGCLFGWLMKMLWDAVKDLRKDIRQIERDLPDIYVRKDDWRTSIHDLKDDMQRGFDKLDATIQTIFKRIDLKINDK